MKKKNIIISIRMEQDYVDYLKQLARKRSVDERINYSFSDLIREAIEKVWDIKKK